MAHLGRLSIAVCAGLAAGSGCEGVGPPDVVPDAAPNAPPAEPVLGPTLALGGPVATALPGVHHAPAAIWTGDRHLIVWNGVKGV